jgi:carbon monoxide dehydrogenase subunit G
MGTVTRTASVRRPVDEVAKVAVDPDVVFPIMGAFGTFDPITRNSDGSQEWALHIDVGTIHVGSRIRVEPPTEHTLVWRWLQGTRHHAHIDVSPAGDGATVTMSVTLQFAGFLAGWITGTLAQGILGRRIEAGLQQLRHHIEYGA